MALSLQICCDDYGSWSIHGLSPQPVRGLTSLSASLEHARRQCGAAPATIELMIDGCYAVVHQESGWPRQLVKPEGEPSWPTAEITDTRGGRALTRLRHWLASTR
jgi:hypothetical protein